MRQQRAETHYRAGVTKALLDLLQVVNPQDRITWAAMKFEDLVVYSRDWLDTEIEELGLTNHIVLRNLPDKPGQGSLEL